MKSEEIMYTSATHAYTYFYITLLYMHDTATYNIVAINS